MPRCSILSLLLGCMNHGGSSTGPPPGGGQDSGHSAHDSGHGAHEEMASLLVTVTLDGAPAADVLLTQPGAGLSWRTDAAGQAAVSLDLSVMGAVAVAASHPEARIGGGELYEDDLVAGALLIELERFSTVDNLDYVFHNPGTPDEVNNTGACGHCHTAILADWYASPHSRAASNPVVQDLFAGAAAAFADAARCEEAGGVWRGGLLPGGGEGERCYLGLGALPALNDCVAGDCDSLATNTGGCADCHAPGIDGELGGRGLLEAEGVAYDRGVHCDVCHKVESVDMDNPHPGVGGRLHILRPSDEPVSAMLGDWAPLTFGPYPDVLSIVVGAVQRDHYTQADLCGGCHQLDADASALGGAPDLSRWPEGRLPVQSTYAEWLEGPMSPDVTCQSCHMPADPTLGNAADLGLTDHVEPDMVNGWFRDPGSVRRHVWFGPRSAEERMIDLAAWIRLRTTVEAGLLTVSATVTNSGPGHALPTGDPMRSMLLRVEARCEGAALRPVGGDVVFDVGGALDQQEADGDWALWPGAVPGQRLRVTRRSGAYVDYVGFGPFGDGTFDAVEKGLPEETYAGEATILAVDAEGRVTLDAPLPAGDRAYRVDGEAGLPDEGAPATAQAGAPGFAFARVLAGASGERHVPHFAAVDVISDNRLMPTTAHTSAHLFAADCEQPVVEAVLLYRPYPLLLARERGWPMVEAVMARAIWEHQP